jgi:hypothetical protein
MQMLIEARLIDDAGQTELVQLAAIKRELTTDPLGMSVPAGKAFLAAAQRCFVDRQRQSIASARVHGERYDAGFGLKGWHRRQIRTVFGWVNVRSPRIRHGHCADKAAGASFRHLVILCRHA